MTDLQIKTYAETLSDKSEVFNVAIYNTSEIKVRIRLHAVSEKDAWQLAEKLVAAIREHTVDTVVAI